VEFKVQLQICIKYLYTYVAEYYHFCELHHNQNSRRILVQLNLTPYICENVHE